MLRVINGETLLSALRFGLAEDEAVYLQLRDSVVKHNNRCLRLQSHADGSDCQRISEERI